MDDITKVEALLDELIEADPDLAERFIESRLARLALKKRLAEKPAAAPQQQSNDIHSCSYYCTRPECIKSQRDELRDRLEAQPQAEPVAYPLRDVLPDMERRALDRAVTAMADKLHRKHIEGYSGFEGCSEERLNTLLREHLAKGDPIDVANFAAFLHFNSQRVTEPPRITAAQVEQIKRLADEYARFVADEYVTINWNEEALLAPQRAALHAALDALRAA